MKRLTATTALCVLFCTAFAAGKGPAATVPGGYPDSLRSVWLYTEGIKQNTIFHDTVRAREFLTEAIRADSTYAPAYYEMATNGMYSTPDEAVELARRLLGQRPVDFPQETALGALALYVSNETVGAFQPMNVNFGIIPPLDHRVKGKRNKNAELSRRALDILGTLEI